MKWAALTIAALAVLALLWLASEAHYRGCVEAATTAYEVDQRAASVPASDNPFEEKVGGVVAILKGAEANPDTSECSHFP